MVCGNYKTQKVGKNKPRRLILFLFCQLRQLLFLAGKLDIKEVERGGRVSHSGGFACQKRKKKECFD